MPFNLEQRKLLRSLAVGGALIGTLATASSASAALAGGPSAHFTNRPNLDSVTFDGQFGAFKFDVPLQGPAPPNPYINDNDFVIGGYRSSIVNRNGASDPSAAVIDTLNPDTVLVEYDTGIDDVDFNAATFGAVNGGAVVGLGSFGNANFNDATALTGSTSESGTRGHTAGPDLQSVSVNPGLNRIVYHFDQNVSDAFGPSAANFDFIDVDGNTHNGALASVDDDVVNVDFNAADDVTTARQATVDDNGPGADVVAAESRAPGPPQANVTVPNKNPLTDSASLVSVELQGEGTLLFTYDQPIGNPDTNRFKAVLSNGVAVDSSGASVQDGDTVKATFDVNSFFEHIVYGSAGDGAVDNAGNANDSIASGKPAGGNVGAQSTGYTTAPDAISATINRSQGQVTVLFDSRISATNPADVDEDDFDLVDDTGVDITTQPNGAFVTTGTGPTQSRVVLQFDPQDTNVADYIRIEGQRVDTSPFAGVFGRAWNNDFAVRGTIPGDNLPNTSGPENTVVPESEFDRRNVQTIIDPEPTSTLYSK